MNPQKLTLKSQEALQQAQGSAEDRGHPALELEHLLAALLEDAEGLVPRLLDQMGADVSTLRDAGATSLVVSPSLYCGEPAALRTKNTHTARKDPRVSKQCPKTRQEDCKAPK